VVATTAWVALFNSDILVNPRFSQLTSTLPHSLAATGLRLDCQVHSELELEYLKMHPFEVNECSSHGTAAFDFFLWKHGFWNTLLHDRGGIGAVDMYIGEAKWDGLMVHLGQPNITDVSPFHMLIHVSGLRNPAAKGWRAVSQRDMDLHRNNSLGGVYPDNVHNAKTVCKLTLQDPNWGRCRMRSTVYEAEFQLCPSGEIRKIEYKQRKMYREAVGRLNSGFPAQLSRQIRSLENELSHAMGNQMSSSTDEKVQGILSLLTDRRAELERAFPHERLKQKLELGSCMFFLLLKMKGALNNSLI